MGQSKEVKACVFVLEVPPWGFTFYLNATSARRTPEYADQNAPLRLKPRMWNHYCERNENPIENSGDDALADSGTSHGASSRYC